MSLLRALPFFFLCVFADAQTEHADRFWLGAGIGVSGGTRTVMGQIPLSFTYLLRDRIGFTLSGELNGRFASGQQANSLNSYNGAALSLAWNFRPFNTSKLVAKAGVSRGRSYYLGPFLGSVTDSLGYFIKEIKSFDTTDEITYGFRVSGEWIKSNANGGWSFELFAHLMKYSYAGVCVKFNLGAL